MLEANREDIEGLILWSSNRAAYQVVGCQRTVRDVKYYNLYREVPVPAPKFERFNEFR